MRLKEALKGLLPQTNPLSLRILPARSSFREAGFRRFLRKHPRIQHIPCQCAHWRGIEDHFGFWNDCRWQSPFVDFSAFSRNAPWRSPTQWVRQITQFRSAQIGAFFRAGSALAPTSSLLRPGRFLRGAVRRAANLIYDCQWQSHLDSSALPTAPP